MIRRQLSVVQDEMVLTAVGTVCTKIALGVLTPRPAIVTVAVAGKPALVGAAGLDKNRTTPELCQVLLQDAAAHVQGSKICDRAAVVLQPIRKARPC